MLEEALEHGFAGQGVELALGGFGIVGLGAEGFAGGAEPLEPVFVFGAELFFEFFAEALGERGAFAVGGDGDLEIAALDDGAVVEVAVLDVVDGVAEDSALVGFEEDGGVDVWERGGGDDEKDAGEIFGREEFWEPGDFAGADVFGELWGEFRGDDGDAGAGFEEGGDFGGGDGAAADDEDGAVEEF